MAMEMSGIDLGITSNGRTIYELTSMKVPIISIAQNDRETMHLFSRYSEGVDYCGIACNVRIEDIRRAVEEKIKYREKRYRMYVSLPAKEIRKGGEKVKGEILSNYWKWRGKWK